jgi:hypothetical protein
MAGQEFYLCTVFAAIITAYWGWLELCQRRDLSFLTFLDLGSQGHSVTNTQLKIIQGG